MPGKIKVKIVAGRNLPVMDRATDLTDAFVEIKFDTNIHKTEVYRKSLHPQFNSEWFKFEVDDEDLQDEPLQIKVLDHDTYSAHDAIGKIYIDLKPLLTKDGVNKISGWFPIYDTMHGIRGELNVIVKVDLISDVNKFRQSSCGINFYCCPGVPRGLRVYAMQGFVEELVVEEDPDYQWMDKIRSMRASNETRQVAFSKMSGELQRKIGLKVLEMGGNAVIGYRQCFDLEGESGIVVRAIGTAVTLHKHSYLIGLSSSPHSESPIRDIPLPEDAIVPSSPTTATPTRLSASPSKMVPVVRRSSESDISTPPKGSLTGSSGSGSGNRGHFHRPFIQPRNIEMMEYPFFTIKSFPPGFLVHLGGVVSARSVKLLDRIHNPDEPETRDNWWTELRMEIRSHARSMGCNAVVGYSETTTICDEIIILSASGTAAMVSLQMTSMTTLPNNLSLSLDRPQFEKEKDADATRTPLKCGEKERTKLHVDVNLANQVGAADKSFEADSAGDPPPNCSLCHIPYNENSLPYSVNFVKCAACRKHKVPDVLFTTIEPPPEIPIVGKGSMILARICRTKKDDKVESNAKEVSDSLPFMEIELYNQLLSKCKIKGMNALFALKISVSVGEKLLVALGTATAVYLYPLPAPSVPKLVGKDASADASLEQMQHKILCEINKNKDVYGLNSVHDYLNLYSPRSNNEEVEDEHFTDSQFGIGNKETYIIQVDDNEESKELTLLMEPPAPEGFDICNTECMPGMPNIVCNLQTFTRVWRGKLNQTKVKTFSLVFDYILKSLFFKLRKLTPCVISHVDFDIDLPEEDEVQVSITGCCVGVGEPQIPVPVMNMMDSPGEHRRHLSTPSKSEKVDADDMMFHMEMTQDTGGASVSQGARHAHKSGQTTPDSSNTLKLVVRDPSGSPRSHGAKGVMVKLTDSPHQGGNISKSSSKARNLDKKIKYHIAPKRKENITLTPLSFVPGAKIGNYLGHLNFCIIRETTSVKEEGGLNGFMHRFVSEVMAICRAHVVALGGNALVAYQLSEIVLDDNLNKNQSQCLVNVYGDVVHLLYETDTQSLNTSGGSIKLGGISPLFKDKLTRKASPQHSPKNSPKQLFPPVVS